MITSKGAGQQLPFVRSSLINAVVIKEELKFFDRLAND